MKKKLKKADRNTRSCFIRILRNTSEADVTMRTQLKIFA